MFNLRKGIIGIVAGSLVLLSTGLAIAIGYDDTTIKAEQRLKLACKRKAGARTPNGQRDMVVGSYTLASPTDGVVKGSFKTEFRPHRWTPISWTCHINPASRRVLSVEYGWTGGGTRLLAAARLRH